MQIDSAALEKVTTIAVYETNNELKKAAQAEFENFLFQLPLESFQWLLESHSPTVLLATSAKLAHNLNKIENIPLYLDKVNTIFRNWFTKDGRFIRRNGNELQTYCVNTFGFFIGKSLKEILRGKGNNNMVIQWLTMPAQGDKYRLYLFLVFMQTIEVAEPGMSFIQYKLLLTTFQEHYIPRIFTYLYPYFINFSDDIDIAGLTLMQDRLTLANVQPLQNMQISQRPFSNFSLFVFKLLSQIVNFRFDVNHKQFDQNSENMQIISFPNGIVKQIIKKDFLNALYSIINRLLQISDEKYFILCLECLEKILAVKLTYIELVLKKKFISINLKGIVHVLLTVFNKKIENVNIWMKVISCSNKFMLIFRQCTKEDLGELDKQSEILFVQWVNIIFQFPCMLMKSGQPINSENLLFIASVEAMQALAIELWNHKIDKNLKDIREKYQQFVECFFKSFILTSTNILGDVSFQSLDQFKKISLQFLQKIASTSTSCYQSLFRNMKSCLIMFSQNISINEINLQNLFLFLSSMIESPYFFEQNWCGENLFQIKDKIYVHQSTLQHLADLFNSVFQFISAYSQLSQSSKAINRGVIIFYQTLLTRFLTKTTCKDSVDIESSVNELTITDELFYLIKRRSGIIDQELILNGLRGLSRFIKESEITSIEFIFGCLYRLIAKIKHLYSRQRFKNTVIYQQMLVLFMRLINENLSKQLMRWRVLLFKSISLLSFDDVLDDYRFNIRNTVQLIKQSSEIYFEKVLYDLTGICDGIESDVVFQYFINKFMVENNYQALIGKLFEKLGRNQTYLKDILHLTYLFIQGKHSKASQITTFSYQILSCNLPFWNIILQKLGGNQQKIQIFDQMYLIYKAILSDGHINICIVDTVSSVNLRIFLKLSIDHLIFFMDHVQNYPQIINKYYQTIQRFFNQLKNVFYNDQDKQLTLKFTSLIQKIMLKFLVNLENVINDSSNQIIFNTLLNILKNYFQFLQQSKSIIHRKMYSQYLPSLITLTDSRQQLLVAVIMIGLHLGNKQDNSSTLTTVSKMVCNIIQCYNPNSLVILDLVGLKQQKDKKQFLRVYDNIQRNLEDWAFVQLQDWFKMANRYVTLDNDDDGY